MEEEKTVLKPFVHSLAELHAQFDEFTEKELFSVGNNQSPYYFLVTQVIIIIIIIYVAVVVVVVSIIIIILINCSLLETTNVSSISLYGK